MKNMKVIASALLFTVIALAGAPAYSGIDVGSHSARTVDASDKLSASGKVLSPNDARNDLALAFADFKIGKFHVGRVCLDKDRNSTKETGIGTVMQFVGTTALPIPAGMDPHQHNSTLRAASGVRTVCW